MPLTLYFQVSGITKSDCDYQCKNEEEEGGGKRMEKENGRDAKGRWGKTQTLTSAVGALDNSNSSGSGNNSNASSIESSKSR